MLLLLADLHELLCLGSENVELVTLGVDIFLQFEYLALELCEIE